MAFSAWTRRNKSMTCSTKTLAWTLQSLMLSALFLSRLENIEDPEQKRKIIGNTFINIFEEEAAKIEAAAEEEEKKGAAAKGRVEWLLQGTLYPDVIESISFKGPSATIKTHHNVGGLLKDMKLKLIEPLRELFKGADITPVSIPMAYHSLYSFYYSDEVRALGRLLSIPAPLVQRHPFPGPGLAIPYSRSGPIAFQQVKICCSKRTVSISRKSAMPDYTTRLVKHLLYYFLSRPSVSWETRGRMSR